MRYVTTLLVPAALGLALLGVANGAYASSSEATACAQAVVNVVNDKGYRLRSYDSDSLTQGSSIDYDVTLNRGVDYVLFACGDGSAYDLDIYLYDENGNLIEQDRLRDNHPVVKVTPRWTGPFRMRVKMYVGLGRANYTMVIMYR